MIELGTTAIDIYTFFGVVFALVLGGVGVWIYDSNIPEKYRRILIGLIMAPYWYAVFVSFSNILTAIVAFFPLGIVALKLFGRMRAGKKKDGDDSE